MRLPSLLLSVLVVPSVLVVAPVVTPSTAAPRPVEPSVEQVPLAVPDALAELEGRRTVVLERAAGTEPFSTVGVTWTPGPQSDDVVVRVRVHRDGAWTAWVPLESETGGDSAAPAAERRDAAGPAWVGPSDGVQVRVDVLRGDAPQDLELVLVDPGSSPADASAATPASSAHADDSRPVIRSRADWGADERLRKGSPAYAHSLQAVVVHHTADANNSYAPEDVPAMIRGMYAFHVSGRGWSDLGYNLVVDRFGRAWEGRAGGTDRPVIGSHAGGFNTGTTGISMMGTFNTLSPSPAVVSTVAQLSAWKLGLYGRDPGGRVTLTSGGGASKHPAGKRVDLPRIFGHRDTGSTACPGDAGYAQLPEVRRQAAAAVAGSEPRVQPFGSVDEAGGADATVSLRGWAVDPDSSDPVRVVPTVDGVPGSPAPLAALRADVQSAHPPYPLRSGFQLSLAAEPGDRVVCLSVQNQSAGSDQPLGCRTVTVRAGGTAPPPVRPDDAPAEPDPEVPDEPEPAPAEPVAPPAAPVATPAAPVAAPAAPSAAPPGARATDDSCPDGRVPSGSFSDTIGSVHRDAVECAVWWDVVRGRADGTFGPGEAVTRGHMALLVARTVLASGGQLPATPPRPFDDLGTSSAEVRLAVEQLAAVEVLRGTGSGRFDPTGSVTRGQMASFLAGAYAYRTGRALPAGRDAWFDDVSGSVHAPAIGRVAAAGISGGTAPGRFEPGLPTTRGQAASFLTRTLDLLVEEGTTPRRS